jgi:hypothetical protein
METTMSAQSPFRPFDVKNPFLAVQAIPTPFEHDDRAAKVASDAAEGTYTYAMIPSAPVVDAAEVESTVEALEVEVRWGDQVIHLGHLTPPRSFFVGEDQRPGASCDLLLPESKLGSSRAPIVLVDERGAWAVIPASATTKLDAETLAAAEPCAELAGAKKVLLSRGQSVETTLGDFTFRVASTLAARKVAGHRRIDKKHVAATAGSALVHGAFFAALAFMMPALGSTSEEGIADDQQYRLMQAIQGLQEKESEREKEQAAEADKGGDNGGSGSRAEKEEGSMGSQVSKETGKRYSLKGDAANKDLKIPREIALQEAQNFGMIGIINTMAGANADVPRAEWGEALVGNQAQNFNGSMWGAELGESGGAGGLGLSGIGEGGGGKYQGIGLGNIGTIGSGSGNCTSGPCEGFGRGNGPMGTGHKPKTPTMRPGGSTTVGGRLPSDVIQRVVRQNFGRFRACYEAGLRNNPNLAGRVAVAFVIGRDGSVGQAQNAGSDLPDGGVVSCVTRAFYGLSFPAPESGIVTVTYPIAFSPG